MKRGRVEGRLAVASGAAVGGARIELAAVPLDGPGNAGVYTLTGLVPPSAVSAAVGFRVGVECGCSGTADVRLYGVRYGEAPDGANRVPDPGFADGLVHWRASGTTLEPSDRGPATIFRVSTSVGQVATLDSAEFTATPGARFTVEYSARVAPRSRGSGYFDVLFHRAGGDEAGRRTIPFKALARPLATPRTGPDGRFSSKVGRLPAGEVLVEAWYRGDGRRFPAYAALRP